MYSQPRILEGIPIIIAINREIESYVSNLFKLFITKLELSAHPKDKPLAILDTKEICKEANKLYPIILSDVIWTDVICR